MPVAERTKRNKRLYKLYKAGASQRELARMEEVHVKTVWEILKREERREMGKNGFAK